MDRVYVILEIFARHARTREAKLQIEMLVSISSAALGGT